jgi:tetratricopeptide (TPR) repeat protein
MNKIFIIPLIFAAAALARPINEGNELFRKGDFQGALKKYEEARKDEPANPLVFYNIGTCQYRLGDYEAAQKELESAVRMPDSALASKAAFNLANTFYRIGEKSSEPSERIAKWREAVGYLKKAIDLDPNFENAKRNVEIVQRKLKEEIDRQKEQNQNNPNNDQKQPELSDAAKQALARALQMCRDGAYSSAKSLLENTMSADSTASSLGPYIQRIEDVIDIKAGRAPKSKIDQSNADNDLGVI